MVPEIALDPDCAIPRFVAPSSNFIATHNQENILVPIGFQRTKLD
jgi:hypothetical protein